MAIDAPELFSSPAAMQWARERNITDPNEELRRLQGLLKDLDDFIVLAGSDPRLIPILRPALDSLNREVRDTAAQGLAQAKDTESIARIGRLIDRGTPDERRALANSLLAFDDPAATAIADKVLPPKPSPLDELRQGHFEVGWIQQVVDANQTEAIPLLKAEFDRIPNPSREETSLKDKIAYALVALGLRESIYWDFVFAQARSVIESGAPTIYEIGPDGRITGISHEYVTWAKAHGFSYEPEDIIYTWPGKVMTLAMLADTRSIPLLREGLTSGNQLLMMPSMMGLGNVHDPEVIRFAAEKCQSAPAEAWHWAFMLLQSDDDPKAEEAVGKYLSPQMLEEVTKHRGFVFKGPATPNQP